VKWVTSQGSLAKVRPDMRIVVVGDFDDVPDRLEGTLKIMRELAKLAARKG
jgi:transcription-repair coupling factor (superfamily II helicase)